MNRRTRWRLVRCGAVAAIVAPALLVPQGDSGRATESDPAPASPAFERDLSTISAGLTLATEQLRGQIALQSAPGAIDFGTESGYAGVESHPGKNFEVDYYST
jgi:hypothetical protein